jgi:molybdopterin/thiamine biosynthesis adenylyltransferase
MAGAFPVIRDADRVRRLLALPSVRPEALDRLAQARVTLVGVGGLGSAAAPYLAAAGVGRLRLIDPGAVAATDLGRQILYAPGDVGAPKVECLARRLQAQNPALEIEPIREALDDVSADRLLAGSEVVLDGLDLGPPRDTLNRWAVRHDVPVVFGGALGYEGQVMVVAGGDDACLACLFGSVADAPGECAVEGVLGPLVGIIGSLQATEALKIIMGLGTPLRGRILQYDAFTGTVRVARIPPRRDCPVCAQG